MKKTLIAVAALAATGAFAQSNVNFGGVVDVGYRSVTSQTPGGNSNQIANNGSATSNVTFTGVEDLGGGMKATLSVTALLGLASPNSLNSTPAGWANNTAVQGAFNYAQFVGLSGGFGTVNLGSPNSVFLATNAVSQPFRTNLGSGYSTGFGRLTGGGVFFFAGGPVSTNRVVLHEKTIQYVTPKMAGFTGTLEYAAGNDNNTNRAANTEAMTALGLAYNNGPLNVAASSYTIKAGNNGVAGSVANTTTGLATGATANPNAVLPAGATITHNFLAGNYSFGATTVYAGYTTTKGSGTALNDGKSWNVAAKYMISPSLSVAANYLKTNESSGVSAAITGSRSLMGAGADYSLSKRTALYARYEKLDTNTSSDTAGEQTTYMVGVRHAF